MQLSEFEEALHPLTGNFLTKVFVPHPERGVLDFSESKLELVSDNIDIIKVKNAGHIAEFGRGRKR